MPGTLAFRVFLFFFLLSAAGIAEDAEIPKEVIDSLTAGTEFILYSLDPGPITFAFQPPPKPEENLDGFKILGRLSLTDLRSRVVAVAAFNDAIHASDPLLGAMCFRPRHALRVIANRNVFDFIICYERQKLDLYKNGVKVAEIGVPGSPDRLDKLLSAARIPLAEPPSSK
jgi:hypothetical protein